MLVKELGVAPASWWKELAAGGVRYVIRRYSDCVIFPKPPIWGYTAI
jgi:hypothetical protein